MRVLVAADAWYPDRRGGAARVAADTAALLATSGHAVEALVPESPGRPEAAYERGVLVHRVLPRGRLPQTVTDPFATRAFRAHDADLVLAHATTVACGFDAPVALVYHASAVREGQFERAAGHRRAATLALELPLRLLERRAIACASRVFVLSEFSRMLVAEDHPLALDRTLVVRGGVDTATFSPGSRALARARLGIAPDARVLLTVRRLERRMGLDLLIAAFRRLRRPGLELAIVGDGSLRTRLAELAGDGVRLVGGVDDATLRQWYRAADLFVLPTVAYEGFGIVTAEALACGVPVVATPVGATPELVAPLDRRLLSTAVDESSLAEAIERGLLLAADGLGARARLYAEAHLSWNAAFPSWHAALLRLHDERRGRDGTSSRGRGRRTLLRWPA